MLAFEGATLERRKHLDTCFGEIDLSDLIDMQDLFKLPPNQPMGRSQIRSSIALEFRLHSARGVPGIGGLNNDNSILVILGSSSLVLDLNCKSGLDGEPPPFDAMLAQAPSGNTMEPNAIDTRMTPYASEHSGGQPGDA